MQAIKIPFSFSNGGVAAVTDIAKITENQIVDVLLTNNTERAINVQYGVGIKSLLYEPMDTLVFDDFKTDALTKVNDAIDSGTVLDITISYPDSPQMAYIEDSTILVTVVYALPAAGGTRTFSFNVSSDI